MFVDLLLDFINMCKSINLFLCKYFVRKNELVLMIGFSSRVTNFVGAIEKKLIIF